MDLFSIEAPVWSGSNAWAVHGSLSASGAPLVAGDPHRLLELPGVYQQVRLACPEFDVVGLAFPGVPGLPHFGHAGGVAWGITNAMADYQDLFAEELRRTASGVEARGAAGWEPAASHFETLAVRGADPVTVEVIETARGPVISGQPDGAALSLRTPARVERTLGFEALLPLLRSRSCADVQAALGSWVEPVNSVLAADTSGRPAPVRGRACAPPGPGKPPLACSRMVPPASVDRRLRGAAGLRPGPVCRQRQRPGCRWRRAPEHGIRARPPGPQDPRAARRSRPVRTDPAGRGRHAGDPLRHPAGALAGLRSLLAGLDRTGLSGPALGLLDRLLGWDGRMDAASHGRRRFRGLAGRPGAGNRRR